VQPRKRRSAKEIPPHIKNLLAQATSLYAVGDLTTARNVIHDIIKLDNEQVQAYTLMSHIHEDLGQPTEAVNALVTAAMISKRDSAIWLRAARMSAAQGFWQQAIKCYDRYAPGRR
jgi:Tfp pilus assembly protein PilF